MEPTLRLGHLYPKAMNIYGDRGNILCLERRCCERGIAFEVTELDLGEQLPLKEHDLIFIGGAQDREQRRVAEDLAKVKGKALQEAAGRGAVVLAVCGGYQLLGRYYRTAEGGDLIVIPTYTAMLQVRKLLARWGRRPAFWEEA